MAAYGSKTFSILARYMLCALLCSVFSAVVGCSGAGQSIDVLFTAANSRLSSAQEAGAAEYAKPEFEEAGDLLTRAEIALKNKDKGARAIIGKAHAKARLAEALARQSKAETEAAKLEADLEKALAEADRVREERQSAESELAARSVNNE
jgi:hypothetical protein